MACRTKCDVCGAPAVFACPCQHRFYCTKECQRTNWRRDGHKDNCALRCGRVAETAKLREAQNTYTTESIPSINARRTMRGSDTRGQVTQGMGMADIQDGDTSIMEGASILKGARLEEDFGRGGGSRNSNSTQPTRASRRQGAAVTSQSERPPRTSGRELEGKAPADHVQETHTRGPASGNADHHTVVHNAKTISTTATKANGREDVNHKSEGKYKPRQTRAEAARSAITGRLRNAGNRNPGYGGKSAHPLTPKKSPGWRKLSPGPGGSGVSSLTPNNSEKGGKAAGITKGSGHVDMRHRRALSKPKSSGLYGNGVSPAITDTVPSAAGKSRAPLVAVKQPPVVIEVEKKVQPVIEEKAQREKKSQAQPVEDKIVPSVVGESVPAQPVVEKEVHHKSKYKPRTTRAHGAAPEIDLTAPLPDEKAAQIFQNRPNRPNRPGETRKAKQAAKKAAKLPVQSRGDAVADEKTERHSQTVSTSRETTGVTAMDVDGDSGSPNVRADASAAGEGPVNTGIESELEKPTSKEVALGEIRDTHGPVTEVPTVAVSVSAHKYSPRATRRGAKRGRTADINSEVSGSARYSSSKRLRKTLESAMDLPDRHNGAEVSMSAGDSRASVGTAIEVIVAETQTDTALSSTVQSKRAASSPSKQQTQPHLRDGVDSRRKRQADGRNSKENVDNGTATAPVQQASDKKVNTEKHLGQARFDGRDLANSVPHAAGRKRSPRASRRANASRQVQPYVQEAVSAGMEKVSHTTVQGKTNSDTPGSKNPKTATTAVVNEAQKDSSLGSEPQKDSSLGIDAQKKRSDKAQAIRAANGSGNALYQLPRPQPKVRPLPKAHTQKSSRRSGDKGKNGKKASSKCPFSDQVTATDNVAEARVAQKSAQPVSDTHGQTDIPMSVQDLASGTKTASETSDAQFVGTHETLSAADVNAQAKDTGSEQANSEAGKTASGSAGVAPVAKAKVKVVQKHKESSSGKESTQRAVGANGMRVSSRRRRNRKGTVTVDLDGREVSPRAYASAERQAQAEAEIEEDEYICRICDIRFDEMYELEFHNQLHFDVVDDLWVDPKAEKA
ncbi:hypothetical protein SARC_08131 [Sphaeroforma arctica JP610]|uniref:MYND-type domain-containing protein n=1 Tax=Sphaeroforma arctica JP610 TaxID=667725 RepID=A0A0L0FSA2_9EUKA|nr:hypothetical protein SARC_08131 [Sphaeroforma arctica JP610]KNC79476.1 hypothetical protein SARC_08131 [Sphaeroforma arctica JP610]|eukprot:XP_014153378.1 hypothetical protein SARC_08131 [Sphaeroforma arctica JP610]